MKTHPEKWNAPVNFKIKLMDGDTRNIFRLSSLIFPFILIKLWSKNKLEIDNVPYIHGSDVVMVGIGVEATM